MKALKYFLQGLLCLIIVIETGSAVFSRPVKPESGKSIPITILGRNLEISTNTTRTGIISFMSGITGESPSVDTAERLQYDLLLVKDEAPVTIVFDFNKKGIVDHVMLDAYTREQNPPAAALLSWLEANAGKPKIRKKKNIVWIFSGWKIEHQNISDGEDSVYSIEFTLQK